MTVATKARRLAEHIPGALLVTALVLAVSLGIAAPPPAQRDADPDANAKHDATPPSEAIFPPQTLTIRFDHKLHIERGATCATCHAAALSSTKVDDHLTPRPAICDSCHGSDHGSIANVVSGTQAGGACAVCHEGYKDGDGNTVARMDIPRANMVFSHEKHAARNIHCQQCHANVENVGLATRSDLPKMRGCLKCHGMTDAASRGSATSACETCHLPALRNLAGVKGGRIRTNFPSGDLLPPRWLHNAAHTPDFIERHQASAASDSQFCATCHHEDFCTGCHDGRVRPRAIHPNDYLNMHAIEARMAMQKCASCHNSQSFCVGCHQRSGVTMSGSSAARESGRFHPPKQVWSDTPRRLGHHSVEAARNLNACASCHVERDCIQCHGASGIGGGFSPHPGGFAAICAAQMRRNPRPCLACHLPGDRQLALCQ
jgi:hypothetical protein